MGLVIVIGVIVGVWLLWRMLQVQVVRAQVEAGRLAIEEQRLVDQQERAAREELRTLGYQRAKAAGHLTEFFEKHAEAFFGDDDVESALEASPDVARDLEQEARVRGIRGFARQCYIDEPHYPGPEPKPILSCAAPCRKGLLLEYPLPPEFKACPFCEGPLDGEMSDLAARELARWRTEMESWNRFKRFCPLRAAEVEAEENAREQKFDAEYTAEARARVEELRNQELSPQDVA